MRTTSIQSHRHCTMAKAETKLKRARKEVDGGVKKSKKKVKNEEAPAEAVDAEEPAADVSAAKAAKRAAKEAKKAAAVKAAAEPMDTDEVRRRRRPL